VRDSKGDSLLHQLVRLGAQVNKEAVQKLLDQVPEAARVTNKAGEISLEVALKCGCPLEVIGRLLEASRLSDREADSLSAKIPRGGATAVDKDSFNLLRKALSYDHKLTSLSIHLCGHGLSGKTTLLRSIAALEKRAKGRLFGYQRAERPPEVPYGERTQGLEITVLEKESRQLVMYDYG